jgi:hypothetical protein
MATATFADIPQHIMTPFVKADVEVWSAYCLIGKDQYRTGKDVSEEVFDSLVRDIVSTLQMTNVFFNKEETRNKVFSCFKLNMNKITLDQVLATKHLPWDWTIIGMDPNATCEDVVFNSELPWDDLTRVCLFPENCVTEFQVCAISSHKTFDLQYVLDHVEYGWDCDRISQYNENIDFILENTRLLRIGSLSKNRHLKIHHVLMHPDLAWDWEVLSAAMPFRDILSNPQLPWNPNQFIVNSTAPIDCEQVIANWSPELCKHIVFDYTRDFPKSFPSISWKHLSQNACLLHMSDEDLVYAMRVRDAVKKIWRAFNLAITNPQYSMCRNRLMREFRECAGVTRVTEAFGVAM